jgi:hypothetical protein
MAEQWAFNPLVQGSTPWRPTSQNISFRWPVVARIVARVIPAAATLSERIVGGDDHGIYAGPSVERGRSVVAEDPGGAAVSSQGLAEGG